MREAERLIASVARDAPPIEVGVEEWNREAAESYRRLGYKDAGSERGSTRELILLLRRPLSDVG